MRAILLALILSLTGCANIFDVDELEFAEAEPDEEPDPPPDVPPRDAGEPVEDVEGREDVEGGEDVAPPEDVDDRPDLVEPPPDVPEGGNTCTREQVEAIVACFERECASVPQDDAVDDCLVQFCSDELAATAANNCNACLVNFLDRRFAEQAGACVED